MQVGKLSVNRSQNRQRAPQEPTRLTSIHTTPTRAGVPEITQSQPLRGTPCWAPEHTVPAVGHSSHLSARPPGHNLEPWKVSVVIPRFQGPAGCGYRQRAVPRYLGNIVRGGMTRCECWVDPGCPLLLQRQAVRQKILNMRLHFRQLHSIAHIGFREMNR